MSPVRLWLICLALILSPKAFAAEAPPTLWLYAGYGPQPGEEEQSNSLFGLDWLTYHHRRSEHQFISLGASLARLSCQGTEGESSLYALSLFPQLTLYARNRGRYQPFFQVRALGPTYLSHRSLGQRHQASHFAFQAQILAGIHFGHSLQHSLALGYRHYSNANLDSPNDGLDTPFVLNFGFVF